MVEQSSQARARSIMPSTSSSGSISSDTGAACSNSCFARSWGRSLWLPRPRLDHRSGGSDDQRAIRSPIYSDALWSSASLFAVQPPETHHPGDAAQRNSHCPMASGTFSRAKKKAEDEERTLVFVDESAFYHLPMVVRTYAPRGHTPHLSVPLTHDHLSAIGGLTQEGRLFMHLQDHSDKGPDVVRFLRIRLA